MAESKNFDERCVLCLDPKCSPVSIKCGHSFCFGCLNIYKSYKKYPWANKCPICREDIEDPNKAIKHNHSAQNSNTQVTPINSMRPTENISSVSLTSNTSPTDNSLEEFVSLAVHYFDDNRDENDIYFNSYENMDYSIQDVTRSSENFSTPYSQVDEENSYEEGLDFSTDSEDYNDQYDDAYDEVDDYNDYGDDYHYYDEDEDLTYEPGNTDGYLDDDYYGENNELTDMEVINYDSVEVDDDIETYNRYDIDWETVIASDVIITRLE